MASNMELLGNVLAKRMYKAAGAANPTTLELGTINSNNSLTTDSLGPIPKGDYLIGADLNLSPGDRVLVAWCGNDAVVITNVVSS